MSKNSETISESSLAKEPQMVRYHEIFDEELKLGADEVGGEDYLGYEETMRIIERARARMAEELGETHD